MPPLKTKKPSANPHDKRHENGLAAPGRRVPRKRSDGSLGDTINDTATVTTTADTAQDDTPATESQNSHAPDGDSEDGSVGSLERQKGTSRADASALGDCATHMAATEGGLAELKSMPAGRLRSHESVEFLPGKDDAVQSISDLDHTIIPRYPLLDILSILSLLLLFPQWLITIVEFIYAWLTFLPQSSGWALPSLTSNPTLWFQGNTGTPSLPTTLMADFGVLLLWLVLPLGKDLALDLAPAIIALSIGGGSGGTGGGLHGATCVSITALCHLLRFKAYRQRLLNLVWSLLSRASLGGYKFEDAALTMAGPSLSAHNWPRTFLEIHIIAQCIVKIIRRAVSRRAEPRPTLTKRVDPEAAVSSNSSSVSNDAAGEGSRNGSTDGRPPGPPPLVREGKEKLFSGGKKRRKQATFVRHEQPLWAVIAERKLSFLSKKEEHSNISKDASEANARGLLDLGSALDQRGSDQIWISDIDTTEIGYTALVSVAKSDGIKSKEGQENNDEEIHHSQQFPFEIRVNGADWTSMTVDNEDGLLGGEICESKKTYQGRISGLTASTTYLIEFIRVGDGKRVYQANLLTSPTARLVQGKPTKANLPVSSANLTPAGPVLAPQPQQSLRPSSPTSTLRSSIATAEAELAEYRNRLKKSRRDHAKATTVLKKEVDMLTGRVNSRDNDDRQKQKHNQLRREIASLEESVSALAAEIEALGDLPDEDRQAAQRDKMIWEEEREQMNRTIAEFDDAKAEAKKAVDALKAENASIRAKRERLQNRLKKFEEQLAKSQADREKQVRDQAMRDQQRHAILANNQRAYDYYMKQIETAEMSRQDIEAKLAQAEAHAGMFYDTGYGQPLLAHSASPHTADATYDGFAQSSHFATGLQQFSTHSFRATPPLQTRGDSALARTRGRTSSMHSQISGFTDDEAPRPEVNGHGLQGNDVAAVDGSDRGSLREDPMSPAPRFSPIGSEMVHGSPKHSKG